MATDSLGYSWVKSRIANAFQCRLLSSSHRSHVLWGRACTSLHRKQRVYVRRLDTHEAEVSDGAF